ncbi:MAG: hypothetical protein PHP50_06800 [Lachnospiraceae bacterium]|nr:hypothetical protein [Lachnospiraceae bacterium]
MSETKSYRNLHIDSHMVQEETDLRLEKTYELCSNELGLQQSKRDQIIAFYIAVISFVIPTVVSLDVENWMKGACFLTLYILGSMMCIVINRYRIYKEIYWICCRVISQLFNVEPVYINKTLIQGLFYQSLLKNTQSILQFKDGELDPHPADKSTRYYHKKISVWKTYRKMLNSAETILFQVMVLMATLVELIGIIMMDMGNVKVIIIAIIAALFNEFYWNRQYYKHLTGVYATVVDGDDKSFNSVYAKAWFLHNYVDLTD